MTKTKSITDRWLLVDLDKTIAEYAKQEQRFERTRKDRDRRHRK